MTGVGDLLQADGQTLQLGGRQRQTRQQRLGQPRFAALGQIDSVRLQNLRLLGDEQIGQFVHAGRTFLGRQRLQLTAADASCTKIV